MSKVYNKIYFVIYCAWVGISYANIDSHTIQRYLWANYHQARGNLKESYQWYQQLFSLPSSLYTYKGFLKLLLDSRQYEHIIKIIQKSQKTFEDDPDVQLILFKALKETKQNDRAHKLIITLSQKFKTHPEIIFNATEIYIQRHELENALITLNHFLNSSPPKSNNFIFLFMKAQIYTNLGKYPEALKSIKECLALQNQFDKAWLLRALLEETIDNLEEAIKGYTKFLELTREKAPQIEKKLLQLMLKQKSIEQQTNILMVNKSCLEKCLILIERKQYAQALKLVDQCLQEKPNSQKTKLLKIQILSLMERFDQACSVLTHWITQDIHNTMWLKTLYMLAHNSPSIHTVIKTFEAIHAQYNTELMPLLYLADLSTRTHAHHKSAHYLTKAITLTTDQQLTAKLYLHLGITYYEQKQYDKMLTALQEAKKRAPDYPPILNLLAYYYATKGKDLMQAEQFIAHALKKDALNPHFLDTKATILYKKKEYEPAHTLLVKLAQRQPTDATILTHLAKVERKLNNLPKAQELIQKASQVAYTLREKQTTKKLYNQWKTS